MQRTCTTLRCCCSGHCIDPSHVTATLDNL
jgi:hypothetical protein